MTRLFRRGELQSAVLDAIAELGPSNGYVIMQALADRIGGGWQPSPGAVYPALLGLEDAGLVDVTTHDGSRDYALTAAGRRAAQAAAGTLATVADRARGAVVDTFAGLVTGRQRRLSTAQHAAVLDELARTAEKIEVIVTKET
jgi:DNA-binding PadR family transcriptional regulator